MVGHITTLGSLRVVREDTPVLDLANQPLRGALLVFLAVEGQCTRDALTGRLWPERDPRRARHVLSQTVYELRQQLGDGWIEGSGEVMRIGPDVRVDTREFETALERGDPAASLALYHGDFLQSTYLANSSSFELWVDTQRSRMRRLHRRARREALAQARGKGEIAAAQAITREWAEIEPFDDEAQYAHIELLAECGHRTEALQHYDTYRKRLASEEGDLEPLDDLVQLVQRIRKGDSKRPAQPSTASVAPIERRREPAASITAGTEGTPRPAPSSLAVLPFVNLSPEPGSEYLSDGMTEELISVLAGQGYLNVASRTSSFAFKNNPADVREIGRKLNVRWVVEGSVRKQGNQLRVDARLISTSDGYPFWSKQYDREVQDIIHIQEEISRAIAEAASNHVAEDALVRRFTQNTEAYQLYLLGRYHWNQRTPDEVALAVECFKKSIAVDASFAPAHGGLADVLVAQSQFAYRVPLDVLPLAEAECQKALELDPQSPESWSTLAHIQECHHWDFAGASETYKHAIVVNPRDGNARAWYGSLLSALGRFEEAFHHMHIGLQIEPYSLPMRFHHGMLLYRSRNYEQAAMELKNAGDMNPMYYPAPIFLGLTLIAAGRPAEALAIAEDAKKRFGPIPAALGTLGRAHGLLGNRAQALAAVAEMDRVGQKMYAPALFRSIVLGAVGELDDAFKWLSRAYDEHYGQLMFLNVDAGYDTLRPDPRFREWVTRLGLV